MNRNLTLSGGLVAVFAAVVAVIALTGDGGDPSRPAATRAAEAPATPAPAARESTARVVRTSDARQLGRKGSTGVTFTEFLDFECEACGAAFPLIEELRREYAGRVTFVLRYFPIEHHKNAINAAKAVEAAHQQGKLEPMYKRMYETQTAWGEQQQSQAPLFRRFARELGLDVDEYDADVRRDSTEARVREDVAAGSALGVQGTPTFFIDETRIEPTSPDDLRRLLDQAIAGK